MNTGSIMETPPSLFIDENETAETLIEKEDLAGAARILVGIVEKDPNNWRAFNSIGIIAWIKKAWEDAYSMFMHSVSLKPGYTDALINLFDAALKLGRIQTVEPLMKEGLRRNGDNEELKIIVESIAQEGDGIYLSERALAIGRYYPKVELAQKLLEEGNHTEALGTFLEFLDAEGPNAEVYCGLGIIAYYYRRYKDAFGLFVESIKLNPTDPDTFLNLHDAAKECGLEHEAKRIFELFQKDIPGLQKIAAVFEN